MKLSILIPVHNEMAILNTICKELTTYQALKNFKDIEIIFIENGSTDGSRKFIEQLPNNFVTSHDLPLTLKTLVIDKAGLGIAYQHGANVILSTPESTDNHWILFTACDLPFGESDLKNFLAATPNQGNVYLGSKAHSQSQVNRRLKRRFLSQSYQLARLFILNMPIGDTQGSLFISRAFLKKTLPFITSKNFFFTTELTFHALRHGAKVVEVPVHFVGERRPTKVPLMNESLRMLFELTRLCCKYGRLKKENSTFAQA